MFKKVKKRNMKYLAAAVIAGVTILPLLYCLSRKMDYTVYANNETRMEDYTTPEKKTYYDTSFYDRDHLFKAAAHFHLFASEKITLSAHCNGNFAAPEADIQTMCGNDQARGDRECEMIYADRVTRVDGSMASSDIAFGKKHVRITDRDGNVLSPGPIKENQVRIAGTLLNLSSGQTICCVPDDFIDFGKEFGYLRKVSRALSEMETTLKRGEIITENGDKARDGTYNLADRNNAYIQLKDGVNVLNCAAPDLNVAGRVTIRNIKCNKKSDKEHRVTGTQSLIINVDCRGQEKAAPGLETEFVCDCSDKWPHGHGEGNYYSGSMIIWNFYDSSKADKIFSGIVEPQKVVNGCYLAPDAEISCGVNTNGTLIGKAIKINSQSHRADFLGKSPDVNISESPDETTKPTKAPVFEPGETEEPGGVDWPGGTAKPGETEEPGGVDRPGETYKPGETQKPDGVDRPGETYNPGETEEPGGLDRPGETYKPGATQKPGGVDRPGGTAKPGETQKPDGIDRPGETYKPGETQKPDGIDQPGGTYKPGETQKPDGMDQPGETANPGDAAEPTAKPAGTDVSAGPVSSVKPDESVSGNTEERGTLIITVMDSETGGVVPDAEVEVTKPDGEKQKYTTDKNGQIKLENTAAGEYTAAVTRVPSGYQADRTAFTSVVKPNATTKEEIRIRTKVKGKTTTKQTGSDGSTSGGKKQDTAVASAEETSQPETGDRFDARVPVILFLLAIAGTVAAFVLRRKESSCR